MNGLMINGNWVTDVECIKEEVCRFFGEKFRENRSIRPSLINQNFERLSDEDRIRLEAPFELEEIKNAIWNCGNKKAPGSNDFTFKFIKHYWSIMQDDIMRFVKHFESVRNISRRSNSSFITLIPKVKDPLSLSDYWPISLIGCAYKIITKTLVYRLKKVVGYVVDELQTMYIEARNILDGPMIIKELYSWEKKI